MKREKRSRKEMKKETEIDNLVDIVKNNWNQIQEYVFKWGKILSGQFISRVPASKCLGFGMI
jgi:hypothetical protein